MLKRLQAWWQGLISNERGQFDRLLAKTGGDPQVAERLIAFERKRAPQATRAELIRRAIERLELDRR